MGPHLPSDKSVEYAFAQAIKRILTRFNPHLHEFIEFNLEVQVISIETTGEDAPALVSIEWVVWDDQNQMVGQPQPCQVEILLESDYDDAFFNAHDDCNIVIPDDEGDDEFDPWG